MSDIELYEKKANLYDELQQKRPDYVGAIEAFRQLSRKYFGDKNNLVIADFCCGTGKNTRLFAQDISVAKATLIDSNKEFLEIVKSKPTNTQIETIQSDILLAPVRAENDVVISMFAYHHVPDEDKDKYIEQVLGALKKNGILILGEIYTPNKETTIKYYNYLLEKIGPNSQSVELRKFLTQTAESDNYEYKVSQKFAHDQLEKRGFVLLESQKIWPTDGSFPEDVGTFVEIWRVAN